MSSSNNSSFRRSRPWNSRQLSSPSGLLSRRQQGTDEDPDDQDGDRNEVKGKENQQQPSQRRSGRFPSPSSPLARNPVHIPAREEEVEPSGISPAVAVRDSGPGSLRGDRATTRRKTEETQVPAGIEHRAGNGGGKIRRKNISSKADGKDNNRFVDGNKPADSEADDDEKKTSDHTNEDNKRCSNDNNSIDNEDDKARTARANEAARIMCASCQIGTKFAEAKGEKTRADEKKTRWEKHRTWTAGNGRIGGKKQDLETECKMTSQEFIDIVDPYPHLYRKDGKVPSNLQVYAAETTGDDGQGNRGGERSESEGKGGGQESGGGSGSKALPGGGGDGPRSPGEFYSRPVYGNKSSLDNPANRSEIAPWEELDSHPAAGFDLPQDGTLMGGAVQEDDPRDKGKGKAMNVDYGYLGYGPPAKAKPSQRQETPVRPVASAFASQGLRSQTPGLFHRPRPASRTPFELDPNEGFNQRLRSNDSASNSPEPNTRSTEANVRSNPTAPQTQPGGQGQEENPTGEADVGNLDGRDERGRKRARLKEVVRRILGRRQNDKPS
ncbi:hypothetical protein N657DRAFT_669299 [Parathielavia appendiculata]|uniref:Uncharacterized protein n=1 Tax=Parathielavia appendiculata TaxID=2587402 RepID=A0AAN6U6P8_9PEZI|nr:hypothetical protein N657DRAFT_669299 [Parathielavia appendiculata]